MKLEQAEATENAIIIIHKGVKKHIELPKFGKISIEVQNGVPFRIEENKSIRLSEY